MTTASTYPAWISDGSPIPDPLGYGERAVTFLRRLRHPNSTEAGRRFQLCPWQERIVRRIYGPRHPDGSRIVKTVMLLLPRGKRKTSLAAALALLHLFGPETRPAGQVVFAACDREQASIGFKEAANIIREDKRLVSAVTIRDAFNSKKQITYGRNGSTLTALASDGGAAHGLTPSFTLIDEIHAWRGRDLWEAIKSGQAKTDDTLMVIATTAGRGAEGLAADQFNYAVQVAKGEIVKAMQAASARSGDSGGASGVAITINSPVTVNATGGTPEANADLARKIAAETETAMRGVVQTEVMKMLRPGNVLNSGR